MTLQPVERPPGRWGHVVEPDGDAVRVRNALATAPSLLLRVGDVSTDLVAAHTVLPDGTVVLAVDAMTPTGGQLVVARGRTGAVRLDVTHLVPVHVRRRIRARITVLGTVRSLDPAVLDAYDDDAVLSLLHLPRAALWSVQPVEVRLERDGATVPVPVDAYRTARPDPIAADEAVLLQHLVRHHGDVVARLATALDPVLVTAATRLVPVAIDAGGVVLRAETPRRHHDVRLPFASRATCADSVTRELRALATRAVSGDRTGPAAATAPPGAARRGVIGR